MVTDDMIIPENDRLFLDFINGSKIWYKRGSTVYGTYDPDKSDIDYIIVTNNTYTDILSNYENNTFQYAFERNGDKFDYSVITEEHFEQMIKDNDIVALECLFADGKYKTANDLQYIKLFKLDKWKLRKNVSSIASNSFVKAKKKMTVEKDYNLYIGQKSLWHALRLYMFAIQIAETGRIYNFSEANNLWFVIKNEENPTWEVYYTKYKPLFNTLRSTLVKLCDRPKDN